MTISAALDTSCGAAFALARDNDIIFNGNLSTQGRESDTELLPWLNRTVSDLGLTLADISEWTIGTGPGSFAGMRVGISLAKGICAGSGARYRGLPTSLALAMTVGADTALGSRIGILHDARRNQVIYTEYQMTDQGLIESAPADVLTPEQVVVQAIQCTCLATLHAKRLIPMLDNATCNKLTSLDHVDAGTYLRLSNQPWPTDPETAESSCEPVYVRPAVFVQPQTVRSVPNA